MYTPPKVFCWFGRAQSQSKECTAGILLMPTPALCFGFCLCPILQRLHIRESVGLFRKVAANYCRCVVEDDDAVKLDLHQGFHDLVHIVIAIVHEGLYE